jgi:hypothetical protein
MGEHDEELFDGLVFLTEKRILQICLRTRRRTFPVLTSFLNERSHEWKTKDSVHLCETKELGTHYVFVCGRCGLVPRQNMRINLLPHGAEGKVEIIVDVDPNTGKGLLRGISNDSRMQGRQRKRSRRTSMRVSE